jgi:hypothetical protein
VTVVVHAGPALLTLTAQVNWCRLLSHAHVLGEVLETPSVD